MSCRPWRKRIHARSCIICCISANPSTICVSFKQECHVEIDLDKSSSAQPSKFKNTARKSVQKNQYPSTRLSDKSQSLVSLFLCFGSCKVDFMLQKDTTHVFYTASSAMASWLAQTENPTETAIEAEKEVAEERPSAKELCEAAIVDELAAIMTNDGCWRRWEVGPVSLRTSYCQVKIMTILGDTASKMCWSMSAIGHHDSGWSL